MGESLMGHAPARVPKSPRARRVRSPYVDAWAQIVGMVGGVVCAFTGVLVQSNVLLLCAAPVMLVPVTLVSLSGRRVADPEPRDVLLARVREAAIRDDVDVDEFARRTDEVLALSSAEVERRLRPRPPAPPPRPADVGRWRDPGVPEFVKSKMQIEFERKCGATFPLETPNGTVGVPIDEPMFPLPMMTETVER